MDLKEEHNNKILKVQEKYNEKTKFLQAMIQEPLNDTRRQTIIQQAREIIDAQNKFSNPINPQQEFFTQK